MWKTTDYLISLDKLSEDKKQNATCTEGFITNKKITEEQFKKIVNILK